jgi:hypothetical protein
MLLWTTDLSKFVIGAFDLAVVCHHGTPGRRSRRRRTRAASDNCSESRIEWLMLAHRRPAPSADIRRRLRLGLEPVHGCAIHAVARGNVNHGVAGLEAGQSFTALVRESFGLRPNTTPFTWARSRPSPVRVLISSRSNSPRPPRTVSISRPCGVVVSHHASLSDRKPAPAAVTAARTFSKSRVEREPVKTRHHQHIARP